MARIADEVQAIANIENNLMLLLNKIRPLSIYYNIEYAKDNIYRLSNTVNNLGQEFTHGNIDQLEVDFRVTVNWVSRLAFADGDQRAMLDVNDREIITKYFDNFREAIILARPFARKHRIADPLPSIPGQKAAPIKVVVKNQTIHLDNKKQKTGSIDLASADRIRRSVKESLEKFINDLEFNSNVDSRYMDTCHDLVKKLSIPLEVSSIEDIGLAYKRLRKKSERVVEEINESLCDDLEDIFSNIDVLLDQFQDWKNFIHELAITNFDPRSSSAIINHARTVLSELEKPNVPVDRTVIDRLKELIEPVTVGIVEAESVAVPLLISMSNIFSLLSTIVVNLVPGVSAGNAAIAGLGSAAILSSFAIEMIKKFCPLLCEYQPLKFMVGVVSFFVKHYSPGKDMMS